MSCSKCSLWFKTCVSSMSSQDWSVVDDPFPSASSQHRCNSNLRRRISKLTQQSPNASPCFPQLMNFFFFFSKSTWGKKMIRQQTFSFSAWFSVGASDRSLFHFDSHFLLCHEMTWFYSAAHQANSSPPTYQTLLSSQPFKHTSGWDQVLPPSFWGKTSCLF